MTNHLLQFVDLKDEQGRSRYTSKGGTCLCGKWQVWADTSKEIEVLHDAHEEFQAAVAKQAKAYQYQREVNLHTLDLHGSGAVCKGCSWAMSGIDRSRQREAFSNHLASVRKEIERKP